MSLARAGYGMGELMDGKAAVAHEDDAPAWKPATELQGALARLVGQQLVAAPGFVVSPFGRSQQGQHPGGPLSGLSTPLGAGTMKLNQRKPLALTKCP
jgi:hypothetical protein